MATVRVVGSPSPSGASAAASAAASPEAVESAALSAAVEPQAVKLAAMAATRPRAKVFFSFMMFSFIFLYNSLYEQVRLSRQGRGRTTLRKKPRLLTESRDLKPWL